MKTISIFRKEAYKPALVFALLFSGATVLGHALYKTNDLTITFSSAISVVRALGNLAVLTIVAFVICYLIYSAILGERTKPADGSFTVFIGSPKGFFLVWFLVFACWIPCFLAYYPGIISYDIVGQNAQVMLHSYSSHHPPLHTFIWWVCVWLEQILSVSRVSIYDIFQMLFLSFSEAKVIGYLAKKRVPKWYILISLVFFCINPICAITSLLPIKDVYCAGCFMLLSLSVFDFVSDAKAFFKSPVKCLIFMIEALLFCLFRNNAVYALIAAAVFFFIALKKNVFGTVALFLIPVLCFSMIGSLVYRKLGIEKGSDAEMLSVPLQQVAFVITKHGDELDEENRTEIKKFLPYDFETISDEYNPRLADPVKSMADMNFGVKPVINTCTKLFAKYPKDLISAFLTLNLPYWYPFASPVDEYSGRLFIETKTAATDENENWERNYPVLLEYYENVADYKGLIRIFPINLIGSISLPIWLVVFFALASATVRKTNVLYFIIPVMFWLTYLLGPVSSFRYIIPIYLQYPLFAGAGLFPKLLDRKKEKR